MSQGGAAPKTAPIGWVFLAGKGRGNGVTIRWQRGDKVAYVLESKRIGDHSTVTGLLDTISVSPTGWADLAEIRVVGERWVRGR